MKAVPEVAGGQTGASGVSLTRHSRKGDRIFSNLTLVFALMIVGLLARPGYCPEHRCHAGYRPVWAFLSEQYHHGTRSGRFSERFPQFTGHC